MSEKSGFIFQMMMVKLRVVQVTMTRVHSLVVFGMQCGRDQLLEPPLFLHTKEGGGNDSCQTQLKAPSTTMSLALSHQEKEKFTVSQDFSVTTSLKLTTPCMRPDASGFEFEVTSGYLKLWSCFSCQIGRAVETGVVREPLVRRGLGLVATVARSSGKGAEGIPGF